jgi:GNAT superfamily N-acetyltransferase
MLDLAQSSIKQAHLLHTDLLRVALLVEDDPQLQQFFESNPAYFDVVEGRPPTSNEALESLLDRPPPDFPFEQVLTLGYLDSNDQLRAYAHASIGLFNTRVWHIGLFILDTALQGTGAAQQAIQRFEQCARANGAQWCRLGVVEANERASRFWSKLGYQQVRVRENVEMGERVHLLRVMVKCLANTGLSEYLQIVARDRPD